MKQMTVFPTGVGVNRGVGGGIGGRLGIPHRRGGEPVTLVESATVG